MIFSAPTPGMFTQPPPMLPPNFAAGAPPHGGGGMMRSPRGMGVHQPPRQTQPGGVPPGHWQHNSHRNECVLAGSIAKMNMIKSIKAFRLGSCYPLSKPIENSIREAKGGKGPVGFKVIIYLDNFL